MAKLRDMQQTLEALEDSKRSAEEAASQLEEVEIAPRKLSRDQEDLNSQIDGLRNDVQKLEKSEKRLQAEVNDLVDLEKEKILVNSLRNQQKRFDATLNKERYRSDVVEEEKDIYERKSRGLESKVLSELEDQVEK